MSQPEERLQIIQALQAIATHTQYLLSVAITFFIAGVIALGVRDAMNSQRKANSAPVTLTEQTFENMAVVQKTVGRDKQGRKVDFEFVIFPRTVRWVAGTSDTIIMNNRELHPSRVPNKLFDKQVRQHFAGAQSVLAVASTTRAQSQTMAAQVAGKRAATLADWLTYFVPIKTPVYELNLGHYHNPCAYCNSQHSTWRDSIVVVIVRRKEQRAVVVEALKEAMASPRNLPSPERFSTFAIIQHRR
ncbi:MAG: hypothetical protein ACRBCJ_10690 [Hyphomicrobiaceae bacterium]